MSKKTEAGETVAVLGASRKPERYSHKAMTMLREYGHRPVPVNPAFDEILGEKCYPRVRDIPDKIEPSRCIWAKRAPIRSSTRLSILPHVGSS
jgi:predicted CoA-binding protein